MRAIADAVPFFAPELEILILPGWDCLPYDRASPSVAVTSQRMSTLQALQQPAKKKQLVVTTIGAVIQKYVTPFRIRQTGERLAAGREISRERLASLLQSNGYFRVDTVADAGEFAIRGSIVDLFPAGSEVGLRLDFFGDEIESIRRFNPSDQRSIDQVEHFDILPAVEALMDEDAIKRFRVGYRERFGVTATGDPLYQAVSEGRRLSGMDHWLPLFEERMATIFDHVGADALVIRDSGSIAAGQSRLDSITDYHENRVKAQAAEPGSYRPLPPEMLYLSSGELDQLFDDNAAHLITPFAQPDSASVIDFGIAAARDFAPERTQKANVYEAVAAHLKSLHSKKTKTIIASYSIGARERLKGLLAGNVIVLRLEIGAGDSPSMFWLRCQPSSTKAVRLDDSSWRPWATTPIRSASVWGRIAALASNVFWVWSWRVNAALGPAAARSLVNVRWAAVAVAGMTWPVMGSVAPTGTTKEPGVLLASSSWRFTG